MTDVLVQYETTLRDDGGNAWTPRACARPANDGLWEGWIEFAPTESGIPAVRTGRETEQHDRNGVLYWAEGLTQVYLQGALRRALDPGRSRHAEPKSPSSRSSTVRSHRVPDPWGTPDGEPS